MVHSTNVPTYGLSTNDQKKDGFLRLIVFTIVKITSTNKEIVGFWVVCIKKLPLLTLSLDTIVVDLLQLS
jgi:hypothetical protein